MTEKDLKQYIFAKAEERRLRDLLFEYENLLTTPRSPNISPCPVDRGGDTQLKLTADIQRIDEVTKRLNEAIARTAKAELVVDRARKELSVVSELNVFNQLYFIGNTIADVAEIFNYSIPSIYRIRRSILRKVASLE